MSRPRRAWSGKVVEKEALVSLPILLGLPYSPWTERARFALDHHGIAHRFREHRPLLGEPSLRRLARRAGVTPATVPVWIDGAEVLFDSCAIAAMADRVGQGPSLRADAPETLALAARLEPGLNAGRALVSAAILADPVAQREAVAPLAPGPLAYVAQPVARVAVRFLTRKYDADPETIAAHLATMRATAAALRAELGGRRFLGGDRLSFADLLAASFLQCVSPVDHPLLRLGPATRRAWRRSEVAGEFAALLAYRDAVYEARPWPVRAPRNVARPDRARAVA